MLASKKERKEVHNFLLADLDLQQLPGGEQPCARAPQQLSCKCTFLCHRIFV